VKNYTHIALKKLDFNPKKVGDLVYEEGPVLSHFIGDDGKQYFFTWVDSDEQSNRWMVFEVNNKELYLFFNNRISLKSIVQQKDFVYTIDLNESLESLQTQIVDIKNIPENYLPATNSNYDEDNFELYAQELKTEIDFEFRFNKLIKNSLTKSFSKSSLIPPLIDSLKIPSFFLFGHIQYLHTIYIMLLIDSALNFELTSEKKFEEIGYSIINGYSVNQAPNKIMKRKFPIDDLHSDFYKFLSLYKRSNLLAGNKYLQLTELLKTYYIGLSKKKEVIWIDALEQKINKELIYQ